MKLPELIPTKYTIPGLRADEIVREPLCQQLDLILQYPLTVVCAQAGSGKTTAVAEWARGCASHAAWLVLEEMDNDLPRFWRYLIAALRRVDPDIGLDGDMPAAAPYDAHLLDNATAALIGAIVSRGERLIIILDNYQHIRASAIHRLLAEWIAHAPSFFHTVLISRTVPPLPFPLATFRAGNQLKQISYSELRFSLQETYRFYHAKSEQKLTTEEMNRIYAMTDGWAAGLQLIAHALKNSPNRHDLLLTFSGNNHYIQTYLIEEILAKQSADIRKFMLTISILERFSLDLCQAVGGDAMDGDALFGIIVQHHLFIIPLDDQQRWFRFQPLFADVLRAKFADEFTPEQIACLHRRAAEWFEQQSDIHNAVHHAIEGGQIAMAARLLAAHALSLLHTSESSRLLQWVETVKSASSEDFVPLSILHGQVLLMLGRYEEADAVLDRLELSLAADMDDDLAPALNELASERAILNMIRAVDRGDVKAVMGNMPLDTDHHDFMSIIGEKDAEDVLLHRGTWGFRGRLATAERFFTEAGKLTDNYGPPSKLTGYVYATLGEIYYEWNEPEAALSWITEGMAEGLKYDNWIVRVSCAVALSRVRYAQGSRDGAFAVLRAMKEELRAAGLTRWFSVLTTAEIRMEIADGQQEAVREWLSSLSSADRIASLLSTEFERMTYVRALLSDGAVSRALEWLEQIGWKADREKRVGSQIESAILQALCFAKQRKEGLAIASLERGVSLAIQERYSRLFLDEGAPMMDLLLALHDSAPKETKDWIQEQLALFPRRMLNESGDLTVQERTVLRKLAEGMTNREISEQLSIAVGTVKAHTNKIYQKLGVKNRVQALQLTGLGYHQKQKPDDK